MKLLNILGAVIAVHIAVLVLAIVIPGCRSTQTTPANPATGSNAVMPAPAARTPFAAAPEMTDADLNPPLAAGGVAAFDPNAPARSPSGTFRSTPTRPGGAATSSNTALAPSMVDPVPAETYTVQRGDSLWSLSKKNGLTVRELASANGLSADAGLRMGQVLILPGRVGTPSLVATGSSATTATENSRQYQIRPGDTLGKIASRHGTTVRELKAFNRLTSDLVRAGDTLAIPDSAPVAPAAVNTASTPPVATAAPAPAGAFKHTVAPGESLTVIASRYGVRIGDIALANKIRDPSLIRPGQELVIPGWEAPAETSAPASVPATPSATTAPFAAVPVDDTEDLDAGLNDEDLDNVPVILVEEPIRTIGGSDDSQTAPVFE